MVQQRVTLTVAVGLDTDPSCINTWTSCSRRSGPAEPGILGKDLCRAEKANTVKIADTRKICCTVIFLNIQTLEKFAVTTLTFKLRIITVIPLKFKLELVFIKHYVPNSLCLTVNSHHVLFVKRLPKFSKVHNFRKIGWIFFFFF